MSRVLKLAQQTEPQHSIAALSIGSGVGEAIARHGEVRVVGVFRHGFYLADSESIFAITGSPVPAGPLHLGVNEPLDDPTIEQQADIDKDSITVGSQRVYFESAAPYRPTLPPDRNGYRRTFSEIAPVVPKDLRAVWPLVLKAVRDQDLASVRTFLCGRGQGLTPEGDDVLAGIVLLASTDATQRPWLRSVVEGAQTTDLSRAFLRWAAEGESVEPVHDLLWAANRGDQTGVTKAACDVRRLGGSTGEALLLGMTVGSTMRSANNL